MIIYITNADTEVLSIALVRDELDPDLLPVRALRFDQVDDQALSVASMVLVRSLGGRKAIGEELLEVLVRVSARGVHVGVLSGEASFDPELADISNIKASLLLSAQAYLIAGGPQNFKNFFYFLSDTVLLTGIGFIEPVPIADTGVLPGYAQDLNAKNNVVIYFYKAHMVSGNTKFMHEICASLIKCGLSPVPIYCYTLRKPSNVEVADFEPLSLASKFDPVAVVVTMLGAGGLEKETATWDASVTKFLDVPVFQAIISSRSKADFDSSVLGLSPLDAAWQVAIPEFDGRIITIPVSFKEEVDTDPETQQAVHAYRCDPERLNRLALLVRAYAKLRTTNNSEKKVAIVLSAYPTKRSRLGNAVGLDTPESVIVLLQAMRENGYRVSDIPVDGIELMAGLSKGYEYEDFRLNLLPKSQVKNRLGVDDYSAMFAMLSDEVRNDMTTSWGQAPGEWYHDGAEFFFPGIWFGNVFVTIQPPRGFGENPIAIYHSPKLAPTHHYLAFYWWLEFGASVSAIIHLGKHGTLEWLPGKSVGMSNACYPDVSLGSMPLIYPFVVNDPGEGTQAKRRSHAVIIDHLIPPLTRADSYNELSELEGLLDAHARFASLDPSKLPDIRRQVWELMQKIQMHHDLNLDGANFDFDGDEFDDVLLEIDGYLCEIKDATIRGGLHILGRCHDGSALTDLILALTRIETFRYGSLHQLIARVMELDPLNRVESDQIAELGKLLIDICILKRGEYHLEIATRTQGDAALQNSLLRDLCEKISVDLLPRLNATNNEITAILDALEGRFVEPGPSGSPSRGALEVLPTGRNFYSIDPASLPTPVSYETGKMLGEALISKYLGETGEYPKSVAIVVWGTAAMRTGGDDLAEALWLIGTRPVWDKLTGKVVDLEIIPNELLMRPRVDVTLRISGFFRDAFPGAIDLFNRACDLVAAAEPDGEISMSIAQPRVFGPSPGAYGSGILPLLESGNWRDDIDIAEVYLTWSGYSYSRNGFGVPARDHLVQRLTHTQVAIKNQDNREHDIFDSDDYLQDHGGMLATIRSLTGKNAKAYFGDSANPASPSVRSLEQEAARVVRSRVLNPKWINAMMNHGYKGAFELSATVDYLYGYDATAHVVADWMYEKVAEAYLGDDTVRKFLEEVNPEAAGAIASRLMEAISRELWENPSQSSLDLLTAEILSTETRTEGKLR